MCYSILQVNQISAGYLSIFVASSCAELASTFQNFMSVLAGAAVLDWR